MERAPGSRGVSVPGPHSGTQPFNMHVSSLHYGVDFCTGKTLYIMNMHKGGHAGCSITA